MNPSFLTGLDMLKQMQALTGCCDTQPPVIVYRDRPAEDVPDPLTLCACGDQFTVDQPGMCWICVVARTSPAADVPDDWVLRSRVADLLHLLQHATISTPTETDERQARLAMTDLRRMLAAAPQAPQQAEPMSLALCESTSLVLRVGQPYVFHPVDGCERCAAMHAAAIEAYGPNAGAPATPAA